MDTKKISLLVGALLMAGVSAYMARSMFGQANSPQAQAMAVPANTVPVGPEVLVATKALPVGTIITADAFRYQPWPKDLIEKAYFIRGEADMATLTGTVVRNPITAGQPITQGALVKPGDRGFLAAALGPGMRAVSVTVSAQSGVAGFVFPGDRVDLVLSQDVAGGGDGQPLKVSETIIRNIRVLATDQRTDKQVDENGNTTAVIYANVTLEATPKMAEKIAVSQRIGMLSLSLRSIADNAADLETAIASGDISVPEGKDAEKRMMLAIAAQPVDNNPTMTVGSEVSRFQRSTVPPKPSVTGDTTATTAQPVGPVVNIARGNNVTVVPLGGK